MPRASRIVLLAFAVSLAVYTMAYVPRLANPLWSDVEFTGWVSPIAHRMVEGQRIYRDFTLPIPPASFALLAGIQVALGRFRLVDELWVCAVSQMVMLVAGWFLVRTFTTARNATLVTMVTSPMLIATPKEIAYDQTALAVAWVALAVMAKAWTVVDRGRRMRWMVSAGALCGLVLAFKSSTGVGAIGGAALATAVMARVAWRTGGREALRAWRRDAAALAAGGAVGASSIVVITAAFGGSVAEMYRVVFVDGPALKGGRGQAILNLLSYTILQTPTHVSFLSALVLAWVVARQLGTRGAFEVGDGGASDAGERGVPGVLFAAGAGGWTTLMFLLATLLLVGNAGSVPLVLQVAAGFGAAIGMLGMLLLVWVLVVSFRNAQSHTDHRSAFAAVAVAAGFVSLAHNLSDPTHRPFYDNNPIIVLSVFSLLLVFDQARLRVLKGVAVGLMVMVLFGGKLQRYLDARYRVEDPGFWSGLYVSANGQTLLRAASRIRELAGPGGTVLMLPEDPMFEALVGRPRPALRGGIVFVDQYPRRLLQHDLATLEASPPDVLVLHPRDTAAWHRVYSIWDIKCAAAQLQNEFASNPAGRGYRRDTSYDTWMFQGPGLMDVYVRETGSP